MRIKPLLAALLVTLVATGCSNNDQKPEVTIPEQTLYQEAMTALESNNFLTALEKLELLEARYPFGRYSEQAQLELIYANYRSGESMAARAAADRFIRLHPNHENIDYAYYLKGLTAFEQDQSAIVKYLPLDETQRDPGAALEGFESFKQLITLYPDSPYAGDAKKRMVHLKNRIAGNEGNVGRYYIKRGAYLAAANRGRYVIENLQPSSATPDALAVMVEAYTLLEMTDLAADAQALLDQNYPEYVIDPVKKREKTILDAITFDLFY